MHAYTRGSRPTIPPAPHCHAIDLACQDILMWRMILMRACSSKQGDDLSTHVSGSTSGVSEWDQLSEPIVASMMNLPAWDHRASASFRQVCKRWRMVHDHSLGRIQPMGSPATTCRRLTGKFPRLHTIDMGRCKRNEEEFVALTSEEARQGLGNRPTLTRLDISTRQVDDAGLQVLADSNMHGLCIVKMTMCHGVSDLGVKALARLPALHTLDLYGCQQVSDDALEALAARSTIQNLGLSFCRQVSDTGVQMLASLPDLHTLSLHGCSMVSDVSLKALARIPTLRRLFLSCGDHITDEGVKALASLTALQILDLSGCKHVTDEGIKALGCLCALRWMNISSCCHVTDEAVKVLGRLHTLHTLDLQSCKRVTDEGVKALSGLSVLYNLNLSRCEQVGSEGFEAVARLVTLQQLHLTGCHQLTNNALKSLAALPLLRYLEISGCKQISMEGLQEALAGYSSAAINDPSTADDVQLLVTYNSYRDTTIPTMNPFIHDVQLDG